MKNLKNYSLGIVLSVFLSGCTLINSSERFEDPQTLARNITIGFVLIEDHISEDHRNAVFAVYDALNIVLEDNEQYFLSLDEQDDILLKTRTEIEKYLNVIDRKELKMLSDIILNRYWSQIENIVNDLGLDGREIYLYLVKFRDGIKDTYLTLNPVE